MKVNSKPNPNNNCRHASRPADFGVSVFNVAGRQQNEIQAAALELIQALKDKGEKGILRALTKMSKQSLTPDKQDVIKKAKKILEDALELIQALKDTGEEDILGTLREMSRQSLTPDKQDVIEVAKEIFSIDLMNMPLDKANEPGESEEGFPDIFIGNLLTKENEEALLASVDLSIFHEDHS